MEPAASSKGRDDQLRQILEAREASWQKTKELVMKTFQTEEAYFEAVHKATAHLASSLAPALVPPAVRKLVLQDLREDRLPIMLVGPNSAGKSSLLNAMLGGRVLQTGSGHVTARIIRFLHAPADKAAIRFSIVTETGELLPHPDLTPDKFSSAPTLAELTAKLERLISRPDDLRLSPEQYKKWAEVIVEVAFPFPSLERGPEIWDSPGISATDDLAIQAHLRHVLTHLTPVPIFVYKNPSFSDAEHAALRLLDEAFMGSSPSIPSNKRESERSTSPPVMGRKHASSSPPPAEVKGPEYRGVFFVNTSADMLNILAEFGEEDALDEAAVQEALAADTNQRLGLLRESIAAQHFPELLSPPHMAPFASISALDYFMRRRGAAKRWKAFFDRMMEFCVHIDQRRQQRCLRFAQNIPLMFFRSKERALRSGNSEGEEQALSSYLQHMQSKLEKELDSCLAQFRARIQQGLEENRDKFLERAASMQADGYENVSLNEAQIHEAAGALKDQLGRLMDKLVVEPAVADLRLAVYQALYTHSQGLALDSSVASSMIDVMLCDGRALSASLRPTMSMQRVVGGALLLPVNVTVALGRLLVGHSGKLRFDASVKRSVAENMLKEVSTSAKHSEFTDQVDVLHALARAWTLRFKTHAEELNQYLRRIAVLLNTDKETLNIYENMFLVLNAQLGSALTELDDSKLAYLLGAAPPKHTGGHSSFGVALDELITVSLRQRQTRQVIISGFRSTSVTDAVMRLIREGDPVPYTDAQVQACLREAILSAQCHQREMAITATAPQRACLLPYRSVSLVGDDKGVFAIDVIYERRAAQTPLLPLNEWVRVEIHSLALNPRQACSIMYAIASAVVELQAREIDQHFVITQDTVLLGGNKHKDRFVARIAPFAFVALAAAKAPPPPQPTTPPSSVPSKYPLTASDIGLAEVLRYVATKSELASSSNPLPRFLKPGRERPAQRVLKKIDRLRRNPSIVSPRGGHSVGNSPPALQ